MKIFQVKGRFANSYIVEEKNRLFIVDVALHGEKYLIGYMRDVLRRKLTDVALVICTHDDEDHSGGVVALARDCGARIGFPYASHSLIKKLWHDPFGFYYRSVTALEETMRPRMWQMYLNPFRYRRTMKNPSGNARIPSRVADRGISPDFHINDNETLPGFDDWIVVHTPGHSWDSCCYFHRSTRSLITGDTLLGSRKEGKLVLPAIYANPRQMAKSLKRLKSLNPTSIYPGHGSCFHGDGLLDHL